MIHPEKMPDPDQIRRPISQAEIALQQYELENEEIRARRLAAQQAILDNPEELKRIGDLLTGNSVGIPAETALDSFGLKMSIFPGDR